MKKKQRILLVFMLTSACTVLMANGEAETSPQLPTQISPVPQQQPQITQIQPVQTQQQNVPDELDMAIRDASDYLNDNIPEGSMIVILNIQSDSAKLSDYIIDELIANAVNDRIFKVIDRQQLDLIRSEQNFQLSGEVDDKLALSIGKFLGARTIVSGRVMQLDNRYRMTIRALDVQTAQVQGQYNRNITAGSTITALMRSNSGGRTQTAPAGTIAGGDNTTVTASASTDTAVNVPEGTVVLNVNNVSTWNNAVNRIRNGGNDQTYIINVTGNVAVPVIAENLFGSVTRLTVTIQGGGTLSISNTQGSLLRIGDRQTVIAKNITLRGRSGNNSAVVEIGEGGMFCMESGALVTGNTKEGAGGGVYVNGGNFTMQSGTISGNTAWVGGGVFVVSNGTFVMEGGTISGNTTSGLEGGGGVALGGRGLYASQGKGTFVMKGGTISDNTAAGRRGGNNGYGGGVSINWYDSTFTMQSGIISGNTATGGGGGLYIMYGTFTKTGGTIHGTDSKSLSNSAKDQGQAVYSERDARWRNATAGEDDNTAGYGFWLND
jgi:TolB-like protein